MTSYLMIFYAFNVKTKNNCETLMFRICVKLERCLRFSKTVKLITFSGGSFRKYSFFTKSILNKETFS